MHVVVYCGIMQHIHELAKLWNENLAALWKHLKVDQTMFGKKQSILLHFSSKYACTAVLINKLQLEYVLLDNYDTLCWASHIFFMPLMV